ncbi:MAG: ArsR/SmtB family transcription factor, partial [Armatimonadota bacterium]
MNDSRCEFKEEIYEHFARIGKAISSPKRLELLALLCQGERSVEVLAAEAGLSTANASQHLQVLRAARLVETDKRGLYAVYRVAGKETSDFLHALQRLAEQRLVEIRHILNRYLESRPNLEPLDRETLQARMSSGA